MKPGFVAIPQSPRDILFSGDTRLHLSPKILKDPFSPKSHGNSVLRSYKNFFWLCSCVKVKPSMLSHIATLLKNPRRNIKNRRGGCWAVEFLFFTPHTARISRNPDLGIINHPPLFTWSGSSSNFHLFIKSKEFSGGKRLLNDYEVKQTAEK